MTLSNDTSSEKRLSGWYHEGKMSDRTAYAIRMTILILVLITGYALDSSSFLLEMPKWWRRAILLAAVIAGAELSYFITIKVWVGLFSKDPGK